VRGEGKSNQKGGNKRIKKSKRQVQGNMRGPATWEEEEERRGPTIWEEEEEEGRGPATYGGRSGVHDHLENDNKRLVYACMIPM